MSEQHRITTPAPLLKADGTLTDAGWSTQPLLDCNLEAAAFYPPLTRFWQKMRIKRWDYYAITTPTHFFSFTISDVGYLGPVFAYVIDFSARKMWEQTINPLFASGVRLARNSDAGESSFMSEKAALTFVAEDGERRLDVRWAGFPEGDLAAQLTISPTPEHESMTIVIPIRGKRFYYNRKINCMPVTGFVEALGQKFELEPESSLASLDWGRGVWEYNSFWVWASASGFLADRRTFGLNLGYGFGDTSAATENAIILDGKVHKLGQVDFKYDNKDFKAPWRMTSPDGRLDLTFTPFLERVAKTEALVLGSQVHQMFGTYNGTAVTDGGETLRIENLIGWAEEHHARW
jgi:hypothetical protein